MEAKRVEVYGRRGSDHRLADQDGEERGKRAAYTLAASYMEGPEREAMLAKASAGKRNMRKSKEEQNLSMWSKNPSNQFLREIGPKTIVENIVSVWPNQKPYGGGLLHTVSNLEELRTRKRTRRYTILRTSREAYDAI